MRGAVRRPVAFHVPLITAAYSNRANLCFCETGEESHIVAKTYSRAELEQRFTERREEFVRLFRMGVINAGSLPDVVRLQLREAPDGTMHLADPDAFREVLTEYMAAAFIEGLRAFLDVVF